MSTDPLTLLRFFAEFVGLSAELADRFAEEYPELLDVSAPNAPPRSPTEDVDPDVAERIKKGLL